MDRAAQKNAGIPVILYFLPVRTIADIDPEIFIECDGSGNRERNAFIRRAEKDIKPTAEKSMDSLCVIFSQLLQVRSRAIAACIDKKRAFSSAFCNEVAKLQHPAVDHKTNELFFILFHNKAPLT